LPHAILLERAQILAGIDQFYVDAAAGSLPSFSLVEPDYDKQSEEDPQDVQFGDQFLGKVVNAVMSGPGWPSTLLIWTYDEHGGRWDHVTPPMGDSWGVGTRVPTIVISPFTRGGNVDGTQLETVSILKLIERRYHLAPLSARDANPAVNDLTQVFDFAHDKDDCR